MDAKRKNLNKNLPSSLLRATSMTSDMTILRKRWPTLCNSIFHYLYLEENSSNCRYLKEASISTAMVPALGSIVEWKIFQSLFSRSKFSDGNISSDSSSITSTWSAFSGLSFKSSITRWFIKGYCQLVGCNLIWCLKSVRPNQQF